MAKTTVEQPTVTGKDINQPNRLPLPNSNSYQLAESVNAENHPMSGQPTVAEACRGGEFQYWICVRLGVKLASVM